MNPYIYNPAYAGVEGHAAVFVMYRDQWTNIETAPQLSHVSFHVPLKGGLALGGAAFNITQGLLNTSAAKVTGAYLINIDRTHFLRFGMSVGAGTNSVNISEFDSPGDNAFENFLDQSTFLLGDFGATYHFGHFNIGFALPNLFSYNPITQSQVSEITFAPQDNMLFKINYRGHVSDDFAIEPHVLYRYSSVIPDQYEATLIAHLYHVVWVGASYRQEKDFVFLGGAKIKEKIGVGFAYEIGNTDISGLTGPTLEVNIGYHLGTKMEHAEHVSSFIKSHRLDAEQRARKAELDRQKQVALLQQSRENAAPAADEDELTIAKKPLGEKTTPVEVSNTEEDNTATTTPIVNNQTDKQASPTPPVDDSQPQENPEQTASPAPKNGSETGAAETENKETKPDNQELIDDTATVPEEANTAENTTETDVVAIESTEETALVDLKEAENSHKKSKDNWDHQEEHEELKRINENGDQEIGIRLENQDENGGKNVVISWVPENENEKLKVSEDGHLQRENEAGEKEIGVKYTQETRDGTTKEVVKWDPVITESQATIIKENPGLTEEQHKEVLKGDPELTNDFRTHKELAKSENYASVKKGTHLLELPAGNFVIAGAFSEFDRAEDFSDQLFQRGFRDTIVGYSSARGYYYVVLYESGNLKQARAKRENLKLIPGLSDVWVLEVTE